MTSHPAIEAPPQPSGPLPPMPNISPPVAAVVTTPQVTPPQLAMPLLEITPCPLNSFPVPQICDSITDGLDKMLLTAWMNKPGPKAWVVGMDTSTNLIISTPWQDSTFTMECNPPPWHFLISGLSQEATSFLVNLQVISTLVFCTKMLMMTTFF
ncbi:hypothetical protein BKA82DRAFT_4020857 [Pisolithus tinctorius]|nr:hypothetical protein BKA82DRAFT_4020857 [Pisolithus tinctorius]